MSTTVSYKGQTLTTVSNDTKTLLTEGKYLEDDLTLVDVSGGGSTLITKNISANGTYNASSDSADGYSQVNVAVPASAVDTGTKNITANGSNQDVVGYAAVDVAVPNSYSASDEGKVVSNGALVAQTAHADVTPTTSDQTIDTTLNNSLKVKGDADLVASNIKKDVEIFGVTGSYEGGGGGDTPEAEWNDVNFWDYDGRLLYSYSASEFANLSAMPENPTHEGLISEGWNWTLADAKEAVTELGYNDIGQLYTTTDGATRIHLVVDNLERATRYLKLACSVVGALSIDWGDNSPTETNANTSATVYTHTYVAKGTYVIKISATSGTITLGSDSSLMLNGNATQWSASSVFEINIGEKVTIGNAGLEKLVALQRISFPTSVSYGSGTNFLNNNAVKMLIFPKPYGSTGTGYFGFYTGRAISFPKQAELRAEWSSFGLYVKRVNTPINPVGNQWARYAKNIERIVFSSNATQTRTQGMDNAWSVQEMVFPASFTSIGYISELYSLNRVIMKGTTPPTLSANLFNSAPTDFVIIVPYSDDHSVLEAYQTATNWSAYASHMQEESQ